MFCVNQIDTFETTLLLLFTQNNFFYYIYWKEVDFGLLV